MKRKKEPKDKSTKKDDSGTSENSKKNKKSKKMKEDESKAMVIDAIKEIDEIAVSTKTTFMENFLRTFIATRFQEYLTSCTLSCVSDTIEGLIVDQFEPELTNMIIRCATPQHGIVFSLKTYFGAIDTLANETLNVIADRHNYGRNLKKKCKIEIRFETAPTNIFLRYEADNILAHDNTRVNNDRNLLAFFNDKNLSYLSGYKINEKKTVNLYSTYLNNSLLTSMIIPCESLNYYLVNTDNSAISTQSEMLIRYRKNFITLKDCETKLKETETRLKEKEIYIKELITTNATLTNLNRALQSELDEISS